MGGLCKDMLNISCMLVSSVIFAVGPMLHYNGGLATTFTFHPFLMGIGFTLHLTIGFWMFKYEDLPGDVLDNRASRRKAHAVCQLFGTVCVIGGYLAVVLAHREVGAPIFGVSEPPLGFAVGPVWLRRAHVVLGHIVFTLVIVQAFFGGRRYRMVTDEAERHDQPTQYHECIGIMVYIGGVSNVLLGLWLWDAWTLPVRCVASLGLVTSMAFGPRWDGSRGFLSEEPEGGSGRPPVSIGLSAF
eukprot:TRINITY_DN42262_c0_g1_i1.p1 TRINITY_DN42262_c0_g1~~TRINITY_DN42262_c0_g1_i1.p1  ORF type:complete len:243 (+),score=22.38 TRINITY_DN42262_c0_g1_i1:256-984(+)